MGWGNRILILFVAFAGLICFMVYKSMRQKVELVSTTYYQDELGYQQKIDGSHNAQALTPLQVAAGSNLVTITFPKEHSGQHITGKVLFYCTANSAADRAFDIQVNGDGQMEIARQMLQHVVYRVQVTWQVAGKPYYIESRVEL